MNLIFMHVENRQMSKIQVAVRLVLGEIQPYFRENSLVLNIWDYLHKFSRCIVFDI